MSIDPSDLVRVTAGSGTQVRLWHDLLRAAGIASRVVGDHLTAGLGTALPGSVELWVHRRDVTAAEAAIRASGPHHQRPESDPVPSHPHPVSDPKPGRSRGPQHGAPPHRPLPS